jgi:hypothetical protein
MTLLCKEGYGDLSSAYNKGTAFSTSKQGDVASKASSAKTSDIPGFKGTSSGSSFDEKSLGESAANAASRHDVSTYISGHARNRKNFTINPEKDPMVVNANKAVLDPIKSMGEVVIEEEEKKEHEGGLEVTCLEGGQEFTKVCMKTLEIELKITPEKSHKSKRWCIGHWRSSWRGTKYDCGGCRGGDKVITQERKVHTVREEWVDTCKGLEANADKGICRYVSAEKGEKETRTLQGEVIEKEAKEKKFENEPITQDHWWERYTYACLKESGDGCASLKARGCVQKGSVCVETVGGVCVQWKQTYQCPSSKKTRKRYKLKGYKSPFCMTGNCVDASYEGNTELFDAMSHLYVLSEAQKDIRANIGIFKGQERACRKNCVGFRDCCTTGKGWGVSMNLSSCNGEEQELAEWRTKNRCVLVGTYCVEKGPLGRGCFRKKTSFCCFGTKLSKIIQEQGRAQLGLGWGDPKNPDCRGFSTEGLSRLDFSRMDLSALHADIQANFKPQSPDKMAKELNLDRVRTNMTHLAKKVTVSSEISEKDTKR